MKRICQVCGSEVRRRGARFCGKCGSKLQRPYKKLVAFLVMPVLGAIVAVVWLRLNAGTPDGRASSAPTSGEATATGTRLSAGGPRSLGVARGRSASIGSPTPESAPTPAGESPVPVSSISSADARNIAVEAPLLLDPVGEYPEFSPDGDEVLFARLENEMSCLWLVKKHGGEKRKLVCPAMAGIWSPDGNKIAFIGISGGLSLFDLKTQQSVVLPTTTGGCNRLGPGCGSWGNGLYWARDSKRIFFLSKGDFPEGQPPGSQGSALDLNNLAFTEFAYNDANQWLRQSDASAVVHPKVDFRSGTEWSGTFHAGTFGDGIWVSNPDGSFQRLVLPGNWDHLRLAPDFSALVFSRRGGAFEGSRGIYISKLDVTERLPIREFTVRLTGSLSERLGRDSLPECDAREPIQAAVSGASINPLNGSTVGANGTYKAIVDLSQISGNSWDAKVMVEDTPVAVGDVLEQMWLGKGPLPAATFCLEDMGGAVVILGPKVMR